MVDSSGDKRVECPECGSTEVQLQRMGVTLYVVCDSGCNDYIIGEVDPWDDRLDITSTDE